MYSHHQPPPSYDPFLEPINPQPLMLQGFVVYPGYFRQDISALSANVINYYQHHPKLILSQLSEHQFDHAFANILPHWRITHLSLQYLLPAVVDKILRGINFSLITHIILSDIDTVSVQAVYDKVLKWTEQNSNVIKVTCRTESIPEDWQRQFNYLAESRVISCRHLDFLNTELNARMTTISRLETDAVLLQADFDNQLLQNLSLQTETVRMQEDFNNQQLTNTKLQSDLTAMQADLNQQRQANNRQSKEHKAMLAEITAQHDLALEKAKNKTQAAKAERDEAREENERLIKVESISSLKSLSTYDKIYRLQNQVKELQGEISTLNETILEQRDISRQKINKVADNTILCEAIHMVLVAKSRAKDEINNKKRKRSIDSGYSSSDSSSSSSSKASSNSPIDTAKFFRSGSPTPFHVSTSSSSVKSESSSTSSTSNSSVGNENESSTPPSPLNSDQGRSSKRGASSSASSSLVKRRRSSREILSLSASSPSISNFLVKRERSSREISSLSASSPSVSNSLVKRERSSKEISSLSASSPSASNSLIKRKREISSLSASSSPPSQASVFVPTLFKIRLKKLPKSSYRVISFKLEKPNKARLS